MMVVAGLVLGVLLQDPDSRAAGRRPEPRITDAQRLEDERYRITEGERSGDAATPDRFICRLERVHGSNLRARRCVTVEGRRRARDAARDVLPGAAGSTSAGR